MYQAIERESPEPHVWCCIVDGYYCCVVERHCFLTCICLMAGGLLEKTWRQSVTRRDVRALHDVTSDMSRERQDFVKWLLHANAHPASRDVGATHESVTRRDVRALHDVTSDMSHERQDFVTWLLHANAHPASRISQYDNSHPVPCFWILLEFRNTIVRVRSRVIRDMLIEL